MKRRPSISVLVEADEARSPRLGTWIDPPANGTLVGAGSEVGTLRILGRLVRLTVPDGICGRVAGAPTAKVVSLDYGASMFRLEPLALVEGEAASATPSVVGPDARLGEGHHAVTAPTDGVFYRGPSPDADPFVAAGAEIAEGQPVGLIEVMKTFHQIVYGGAGLPERAEVAEIRSDDGDEVRAGQCLVVVREI